MHLCVPAPRGLGARRDFRASRASCSISSTCPTSTTRSLFLAGDEPVFTGGQAAVTREAVVHVTDLYDRLQGAACRRADVLRDFVLQCVWCLFAEDLGQIPDTGFTQVVDELLANAATLERRRSTAVRVSQRSVG